MNKILLLLSFLYCSYSCDLNDEKIDENSKINSVQKIDTIQYAYLSGKIYYPSEFPPEEKVIIQLIDSANKKYEFTPFIDWDKDGNFIIKVPLSVYKVFCFTYNKDNKQIDSAVYTNFNPFVPSNDTNFYVIPVDLKVKDSTYKIEISDWFQYYNEHKTIF
jgi:hypothetical protein